MIAISPIQNSAKRQFNKPPIPKSRNEWINIVGKILSSGNICSKEPILRLYDYLLS